MKKMKCLIAVSCLVTFFCFSTVLGQKKPKILVSPKGLVHSFWLTVKAGAETAGKEFGADVVWKGPAVETDIAGQMAIIEDYITKNIDAIVIAACDAKAMIPVLTRAKMAKIPVLTIDSGVDSDLPLTFIATDNVMAAKKAADILAEFIDKKGKVALIPFIPGAETSIWREKGFKEGIKQFKDIKLASVQYSQSDVAMAMTITENILTAHPDLKGIFAANEAGAIGCAQAILGRGLTGKIKIVGFDAADNEITALKNGLIHALIVQDPFKMGYLGVKHAVDALNGKSFPKRIDTGVYVITKKNMDTPDMQKILYPLKN